MNGSRKSRDEPAARVVLGAFLLVTVLFVNLFPPRKDGAFSQSPNEFSRFDLVVSMAERGTFAIDRELAEFGTHEDRSDVNGHSYSNKAPGLSFAALPFYFVFRIFLGPASRSNMQTMLYLLRVSTVSVSVWLALVLLARRARKISPDGASSALVVFAAAFGTPILVYARSFFSHAWSAALLYIAFELLETEEGRRWNAALAGLLAGWAVISEFPVLLLAAALFGAAAWRNGKRGAAFAAGGAPPAILLGIYNGSCFGRPWRLSYGYEWYRSHTELSHRFFGFLAPDAGIAFRYLFSESRGLLFASPILLLLPLALLRPRGRTRAAALCLGASALYFVVMTGYENWHGGWALGSRYLVPMILLMVWPLAALGPTRRNGAPGAGLWLAGIAAAYSAAFFFFSGSTFWFLPSEPEAGIRFYSAFWLSRGWITPSLAGSGPLALGLAAIATSAAAAAALWPIFRDAGRVVLSVLAGGLLFSLLFAGKPPDGTFQERVLRAWVLESFTPLDPGRLELRRLAAQARTPEDVRALRRAFAASPNAP
ncbi:MAG: hypothetical protein ACRD16_15325 [Thermoanaerobaculia bacterium]